MTVMTRRELANSFKSQILRIIQRKLSKQL